METTLLIERVLFLSGFALLGLLLSRLLRLDNSLGCLLAGLLAGVFLPVLDFDTGIRAHNLQDLVFFLILPVLIFEAAWHLQPTLLRRWLLPILLLAVPGVLFATALAGVLMYYGIGHASGFPWVAAVLTAAILAATDPAAVTALLRELRAPDGLGTVLEGESLFNDATTILLYGVVLAVAMGEMVQSKQSYFTSFVFIFLGGSAFGVLCGVLIAAVIRALDSVGGSSIVLLFSALASFFVAEHMLGVSGIMAVTFAALVSRHLLSPYSHGLLRGAADTMEWLALLFSAVLFTLMGLVVTYEMFQERWLAMLVAIGATLLARIATVYLCAQVSAWGGRPLPGSWRLVLCWGGLRGAIAIALVLSLPDELPWWWTVQSMVFGVVCFSLLVQGVSIGPLLRRLGLAGKSR